MLADGSRFLRSCTLLAGVTGCIAVKTPSAMKAVETKFTNEPIPLTTCPDGSELASFVLTAIPALPPLESLGLPPPKDAMPRLIAPVPTRNMRLEICLDGNGEGRLQRVVSRSDFNFDVISIEPSAEIAGLQSALFSEDYSQLLIRVPFETLRRDSEPVAAASPDSLFIRGFGAGDDRYLVATYTTVESQQTYLSARRGNRILVGKLRLGDFEAAECRIGQPAAGVFRLNSAEFKWKGCQAFGTSGGVAPLISEFTITDTSPSLPSSVRGIPLTVKTDSSPTGNYRFQNNHHSVCDSFVLTLPHATYAATASFLGFGGGGCPGVLSDAPMAGGTVAYRIKYGESRWIEGSAPANCVHFTRDCP